MISPYSDRVAEPVLRSVEIEGLLSIRSATVELGACNVLIGAHGSGKTNLIRAFEVLGRLADHESRPFVGASALLHGKARRGRIAVETSAGRFEARLVPNADEELVVESESAWMAHGGPLPRFRVFDFPHDAANLAAVLAGLRDSAAG